MIEPFNPASTRLIWTVSSLLRAVAGSLGACFNPCILRGEISGFSTAPSGHSYFSIKDASGGSELLKCAMFRRAASLLDFEPNDGQHVEVRGRLDVYPARGELQLIVEAMRPDGVGALYEQFLRLKARLEAEGLFAVSRRRAVPAHPRAIGIVTSLGAAALNDVVTTLERRAPHVRVIVYPSKVQGLEAPAELAAAIALAGSRCEVDTLIVCRGGGTTEDLWAFNDERVVRALAASPIPTISGVGHESDVTLSDLVADLRAATPTAAAELSVPQRQDCLSQLASLAGRARRAAANRINGAGQQIDRLRAQLGRPSERLDNEGLRLRLLAHRLPSAAALAAHKAGEGLRGLASRTAHSIEMNDARRQHALESLATRLAACNPTLVVARGYALVQLGNGDLVVDPAQLHAGAELSLTLARGRAEVHLATARVKRGAPD
ncbi:MAG: exodeoxyribonuclease VII large subunit [Burkholderiaceae bacterium]